jgi:hypothetical protein
MTQSQHIQQLRAMSKLLSDPSITLPKLLYAWGTTGLGIRVRRSEASNINPWMIGVEYVSTDYFDTPSIMCALDSKLENNLIDLHRQVCSDVLTLVDPEIPLPASLWIKTKLHQIYTSVVCTRNLELFTAGQSIALNSAALVQAIHQLRHKSFRTLRHMESIFHIAHNVWRQCQAGKDYWPAVAAKFLQAKPAEKMTEAEDDDISNVSKLIVALLTQNGTTLLMTTDNNQRAEVCRAIVSESVSRLARQRARYLMGANTDLHTVMVNQTGFDSKSLPEPTIDDLTVMRSADEMVAKGCTIDEKKILVAADAVYALETAGIVGPEVVMDCLWFAKEFHQCLLEEKLTTNDWYAKVLPSKESSELQKRVCTRIQAQFDERYKQDVKTAWPMFLKHHRLSEDLQIGLALQGLRYHTSATRRSQDGWPLTSSKEIIDTLRKEMANDIWQQKISVIKTKQRELVDEHKRNLLRQAKLDHLDWRVKNMINDQGQPNFYLWWRHWCGRFGRK